ncbi:NlpC/P60 family protein [Streptomyces sp. WAC07061]|uniref:C40 family peptidase n=1 Tax=Streptomyces sp. WAC07061 TaxID=2487410 RepID=UPI000F7783FD|nr:C40 family peptidase [Streptomyces sp. WAC07061]RSS57892.1 NlpC/P60 family protein [Streptomyces sp. WAC07061]
MSHTAHIPSHRKPRRSASKLAVRAGVAGGVLSTLAMAGTASASPSEPVAETTLEMPVLNLDLGTEVSNAVNTAAENTRVAAVEAAVTGELNALEESARTGAAAEAKQAKEDATKAAELKAKQEADRKAEAERAGRSSDRTDLTNASAADNGGSSAVTGSGSGSTASKPATGSAAAIIAFARAQIGKPYVLGSTGPTAYDCSGLVQAAYRQAGITLDRVSQDQSRAGRSVSLNALQPGDIVYWGAKGSAYHVAIYSGNGKFIGAQNPSTGIVERSLSYDMPTGAVRVL